MASLNKKNIIYGYDFTNFFKQILLQVQATDNID